MTTNAVEAWHRALKSSSGIAKGQKSKLSFAGLVTSIIEVATQYDARAEKALYDFKTRISSEVQQYPFLAGFPVPVQKLLIDQIRESNHDIAEGEAPREVATDGGVVCDCLFYRRYQVPCKHVFTATYFYNYEPDWAVYHFMFEESGFEIYETMGSIYVAEDIYEEIGAPSRRKIDVRETLNRIQNKYYDLEELIQTGVTNLTKDDLIDGLNAWIKGLNSMSRKVLLSAENLLLNSQGQAQLDSQYRPRRNRVGDDGDGGSDCSDSEIDMSIIMAS